MSDEFDPKDVEAPRDMQGNLISQEEAARCVAMLAEGKIELAPGVAEQLAEAGISVDELREMLIEANRKRLD